MAYKKFNLGEKIPGYVNKFLENYRAKASIIDRQAYYEPMTYRFNSDFSDRYTDQYATTYYQNVIQLSLSEDDLARLIEDAASTEDLRRQYGPNIMPFIENAHVLANHIAAEERIRRTNPGVQLAWEKYQMMLKIAGGE